MILFAADDTRWRHLFKMATFRLSLQRLWQSHIPSHLCNPTQAWKIPSHGYAVKKLSAYSFTSDQYNCSVSRKTGPIDLVHPIQHIIAHTHSETPFHVCHNYISHNKCPHCCQCLALWPTPLFRCDECFSANK